MTQNNILCHFLLLFLVSNFAFGQKNKTNIKGIVVDENDQNLAFASVSLLREKDSTALSSQLSKENGSFLFLGISSQNYLLKISFIGYESAYFVIKNKDLVENDLGKLILKSAGNTLNEVIVKGDKEPVKLKKDTLEFDASVLKPQQNDQLEDLLKKVPTLEIDENGAIKTQNKTVRKVLVDGKEFFGNDPSLALKNLPAEAIEKIQVIEKKTEQAEFSGVDDGEREVIINVTLKNSHKKGTIGFASAGISPDLHPTKSYHNLKTSVNRFSTENQFSVIGLLNNVNLQGFTPQDASNFATLNRQQNRGNTGGGNNTNASRSSNVNLPVVVGKRPGMIATEGFGLNYNNQYAKNSSLQSSYFFNGSHTDLVRNLQRQSLLTDKTIYTNQESAQDRDNTNHRLNATLNHQFDEKNTIRYTTGLNTVSGGYLSESQSKISTISATNSIENLSNRKVFNASTGRSFSNSLLYRHRFKKAKRTISLNGVFNLNQDKNNDSTYTQNINQIGTQKVSREIHQINERNTKVQNQRIQVSYNEPISKTTSLEGSYAYQRNINNSVFDVWDVLNNERKQNFNLTNEFKNNFIFQQTGIKLNYEAKEKTFVAGGFYQNSLLKSFFRRSTDNTLKRNFENFLPMLRFSSRKGNRKNSSFEYNTSVNEPSVRDLQPITVNNNPQNIFVGNPDLKPEYTQRLNLSHNLFNPKTFSNLNFGGNLNYTKNAIGYSQNISETLVRTTKPINLPYSWNTNLNLNYTFSLGKKQKNRLRFSVNPRWSFMQGNSLVNGIQNENTQNLWRGEFKITYLTDKINLIINNSYQKSFVNYSVNTAFNQSFSILRSTSDFRWKFTKQATFTTEFDFTDYQSSRLQGIQSSIPIINSSFKYLFLKGNRGELMLSVQDLLNQNVYISQRSDENFFETERSNSLGRFYMISFMYSVKQQGKRQRKKF